MIKKYTNTINEIEAIQWKGYNKKEVEEFVKPYETNFVKRKTVGYSHEKGFFKELILGIDIELYGERTLQVQINDYIIRTKYSNNLYALCESDFKHFYKEIKE